MSFTAAIKTGLSQYATFTGRARRSEFWWFYLFFVLAWAPAYYLGVTLVGVGTVSTEAGSGGQTAGLTAVTVVGSMVTLLSVLVSLGLLVPVLAAAVRRLHDTGRSGWWYLISLVPLVGPIMLIVFLVQPGVPGPNMHGPNPAEGPGSRGHDMYGGDPAMGASQQPGQFSQAGHQPPHGGPGSPYGASPAPGPRSPGH